MDPFIWTRLFRPVYLDQSIWTRLFGKKSYAGFFFAHLQLLESLELPNFGGGQFDPKTMCYFGTKYYPCLLPKLTNSTNLKLLNKSCNYKRIKHLLAILKKLTKPHHPSWGVTWAENSFSNNFDNFIGRKGSL